MAADLVVVDACRWCASPMLRLTDPDSPVAQCRSCGRLIFRGDRERWPEGGFPTVAAVSIHPAGPELPTGQAYAVRWGASGKRQCRQTVRAT